MYKNIDINRLLTKGFWGLNYYRGNRFEYYPADQIDYYRVCIDADHIVFIDYSDPIDVDIIYFRLEDYGKTWWFKEDKSE